MKKNAIIVAGGTGSRMNSSIPKQFLLLQGKPVLYYTIKSFLLSYHDLKIILVLPEDHVAQGQSIIDAFFDYSRIQIAVGGRTRFHSVQNGLKLIQEECIIFVHDAVRCLVSIDLIKRCYDTAIERGSAIPVIDSKDSLRLITEEGNEALERVAVKQVQTPQTFHSKILIPAYQINYIDKFMDEAAVVEAFGIKVHMITGEEKNFKITQPQDLQLAELILSNTAI